MGISLFFWIAKDSNYKYKITLPDRTTIFNSKVDIYCCAECMAGVRCNLSSEKSIQASIAILFELSDFFWGRRRRAACRRLPFQTQRRQCVLGGAPRYSSWRNAEKRESLTNDLGSLYNSVTLLTIAR
jgi:hypothetical protein